MRNRTTWLTLLICVNLILLTGFILVSTSTPPAFAQGTGLAGNYVSVAGQIQNGLDALYLIDMRDRTLHAFTYDQGSRQLVYVDFRELERDFRNNRN